VNPIKTGLPRPMRNMRICHRKTKTLVKKANVPLRHSRSGCSDHGSESSRDRASGRGLFAASISSSMMTEDVSALSYPHGQRGMYQHKHIVYKGGSSALSLLNTGCEWLFG